MIPIQPITDDMISQVVAMGFPVDMVRVVLSKHRGDVTKATEELLASGGMISIPDGVGVSSSSVSSPTSPTSTSSASSPLKSPSQLLEEKKAIDDLVSDIPEDEEDYLDLTLQVESQFLHEYKTLLESLEK
ncbi:hypothetical protein ScPMuIL_016799 [Solemya velum]